MIARKEFGDFHEGRLSLGSLEHLVLKWNVNSCFLLPQGNERLPSNSGIFSNELNERSRISELANLVNHSGKVLNLFPTINGISFRGNWASTIQKDVKMWISIHQKSDKKKKLANQWNPASFQGYSSPGSVFPRSQRFLLLYSSFHHLCQRMTHFLLPLPILSMILSTLQSARINSWTFNGSFPKSIGSTRQHHDKGIPKYFSKGVSIISIFFYLN